MDHSEIAQKLHEKANIPLEEAVDVLNRSGWDMLDALATLEREGKIPPLTASMTTETSRIHYERVTPTASDKNGRFKENANDFGKKIKNLLILSLNKHLVVRRKSTRIAEMPVLIALVIVCFMFRMSVFLALAGLIAQCSYSIEDKDNGGEQNQETK